MLSAWERLLEGDVIQFPKKKEPAIRSPKGEFEMIVARNLRGRALVLVHPELLSGINETARALDLMAGEGGDGEKFRAIAKSWEKFLDDLYGVATTE